jgi:hypothetical protein
MQGGRWGAALGLLGSARQGGLAPLTPRSDLSMSEVAVTGGEPENSVQGTHTHTGSAIREQRSPIEAAQPCHAGSRCAALSLQHRIPERLATRAKRCKHIPAGKLLRVVSDPCGVSYPPAARIPLPRNPQPPLAKDPPGL